MSLWLVRSGKFGEFENQFLEQNKIGLCWDELKDCDLSNCKSAQDIRTILNKKYPSESKGRLKNWSGQISVIALHMKPGDLFVMPLKQSRSIAIGRITGNYQYIADAAWPFIHNRTVEWIGSPLPRTAFDQDLLYSFGAFMTFCEITRNNAKERLEKIIRINQTNNNYSHLKESSFNSNDEIDDESIHFDLEENALDAIAKAIIAKYKGRGLESLVGSILRAQGYTVHQSSEGPDHGVDLLAAPGPLGFGEPRICIQVKSSETPIDTPTLMQLKGTMQNVDAKQGLLVSWGGFRKSIDRLTAQNFFSIRLWDQGDLIREFIKSYDHLDKEIQTNIPLKKIWVMAT